MGNITSADYRAHMARMGRDVTPAAPRCPVGPVVLPYPPSTNNLYATVRGRRVLTADGRQFKAQAAAMARAAGLRPIPKGQDVTVSIDVYRPRRAGDLDNALKSTLDSLKGVAWDDDAQVSVIHARRFEDKDRPRVEITVSTPTGGKASE
ncbi:MAG TPA: RusA family crossover junction endodeoxyribonuclease [Tepidisphaeraceae bacterium]|jgi:crossover junction endodeoxyribonuclease RusA|nr:RusA family crossover junction endodeoxyribonuclease [Tepidisphaeraceae bacterium]